MELVLERAVYGEKGKPLLQREYVVLNFNSSAKTTISELLTFCKEKELPVSKLLLIDEIEGTNTFIKVNEDYSFSEEGTHSMVMI